MSLDHDTTSSTMEAFITPVPLRNSMVLVVDQDTEATDQVSRDLEGAGVRVLRANTGMQGYWLAISKDPDAIITELGMPNGGGADMLECLKDNPLTQDIPVIVRTSQSYPSMAAHLQRLGAVTVVDKAEDRVAHVIEILQDLLQANAE